MDTTANFAIAFADSITPMSIEDITAAMASSTDAALTSLLLRNTLPRFADATARDAYYTDNSITPVLGMKNVLTSDEITYRYNGTTWKAWESDWITAAAPTLTNIAIGTGGSAGNTQSYRYVQGRVHVRGKITLGTASASVTGIPTFTLPVTALSVLSVVNYSGMVTLRDDSAPGTWTALVASGSASTTTGRIILLGTLGVHGAISNTSPFTWAATDAIAYDFEYDPA
jgi:hypothetical protein